MARLEGESALQEQCCHCGLDCAGGRVSEEGKHFCCKGCATVYTLLRDLHLEAYYQLELRPGNSMKDRENEGAYACLDNPAIVDALLDYRDESLATVRLYIPGVHCASCVWLLEHFHKLDAGVLRAELDFMRKELALSYRPGATSLRRIAETLERIGYAPDLQHRRESKPGRSSEMRGMLTRLGVAGFCFGNIMLFSFPEYLGMDAALDTQWMALFAYLNLVLSLPVMLFSAREFFDSARQALRNRTVNIDVPIALGIAVLFLRSAADVLLLGAAGYFDSLAGLVFLLLIGRVFQVRTFNHLRFDRDYRSYFPLAVRVLEGGAEHSIALENLRPGAVIAVRNGELIPADCRLASPHCAIDYSFVSGESRPVQRAAGDMLYAGGRIVGAAARMRVERASSQSYLTRLWNNAAFAREKHTGVATLTNRFSKVFTAAVILIAAAAALWWLPESGATALDAFTSTLIIACPCALALSAPFTLGTALKHFSAARLFLKNTEVIENLAAVDSIVFDKTGTLTRSDASAVRYTGRALSAEELAAVLSSAAQSNHPAARALVQAYSRRPAVDFLSWEEVPGRGVYGLASGGPAVLLGARGWLLEKGVAVPEALSGGASRVYVALNGEFAGEFDIDAAYRPGLDSLLQSLGDKEVHVLSGDNEAQKAALLPFFKGEQYLHFRQSPQDKLDFIAAMQKRGRNIMMIGDGLNDAGALRQSNVGVALVEQSGAFTPASDAILDARALPFLPHLLRYARRCMSIVRWSFALSLAYNVVGLSFAVQGTLSPLISAVLMPLSSVTVIFFTTVAARICAGKLQDAQ